VILLNGAVFALVFNGGKLLNFFLDAFFKIFSGLPISVQTLFFNKLHTQILSVLLLALLIKLGLDLHAVGASLLVIVNNRVLLGGLVALLHHHLFHFFGGGLFDLHT